jgi:uncharacterized protein YifE (UPF0438 family)
MKSGIHIVIYGWVFRTLSKAEHKFTNKKSQFFIAVSYKMLLPSAKTFDEWIKYMGVSKNKVMAGLM